MQLTIQGKDVKLKHSFRMYLAFEKIKGKAYSGATLEETLLLLYSAIISACPDISLDFKTFIDWMDDNMFVLGEFNEWLSDSMRDANDMPDSKKKATRKKVKS